MIIELSPGSQTSLNQVNLTILMIWILKILFWSHFSPYCFILTLFQNLGGSKIAIFRRKICQIFAFTLKLHLKDGLWTWVKYIYSESPTYTLHESIIALWQSNPVCKISYQKISRRGNAGLRSEIFQNFEIRSNIDY